jgi:glycosyltransferase involved in cell wall biosynthesis
MKILFDCGVPFSFAHGGAQIQIEQTKAALESLGGEVDWFKWWDGNQTGEIIHVFGRPALFWVQLAKKAGRKVVIGDLLGAQGSRTFRQKLPQMMAVKIDRLSGGRLARRLGWEAYRLADRCIFLTEWEKTVAHQIYGCPLDKSAVIPNGVEEVFFLPKGEAAKPRDPWLVCTVTITERKRAVELARAATLAKVPVWIIGKPYAEDDPYYQEFLRVVRGSEGFVRFEGPVYDRGRMAEIYQTARGFVLLSREESLSLSALEAAAAGCPALLSALPWAETVFGQHAEYCPVASPESMAKHLKDFYETAPKMVNLLHPITWRGVAEKLMLEYQQI